MNVGPAHLSHDEERMQLLIRNFAHALDNTDIKKLFVLCPLSDFEMQFKSYSTNEAPTDPDAPLHFFCASRMIRDMLSTCSSIDFAQTLSTKANVRLYTLSQSKLAPLFRAAGISYNGLPHGSNTNYIFSGLSPEGEISEGDQAVSRMVTVAFLRFVATGNSNVPWDGEEWPEAFGEHGLSVNDFGDPLATDTGSVVWKDGGQRNASISGFGIDQNGSSIDAMNSVATRKRSKVLAREKLRRRCAFVNVLAEKLGG